MRARLLLLAAALIIPANGVRANMITLAVGDGGDFASIGAAIGAETAGNSYTINVAPGIYTNDFLVISQPTEIDASGGLGSVTMLATQPPDNLKGIITTTSSLTVNGLVLKGTPGSGISQADGGNSAAIRDQSPGPTTLLIENTVIAGNQEGVLTGGSNNQETVIVRNSQFTNNGNDGYEHGIYVGDAASLTVSGSLFCGTISGHDIKSRAIQTTVTGNQLYVGTNAGAPAGCAAGSASFAIDVPNGGIVNIDSNQILQGDANQNGALIDYGSEGMIYATNSFAVTNTTLDNLGTKPSIGIQELGGCYVAVSLSGDTFTNIATQVTHTSCSTSDAPSPASAVAAPVTDASGADAVPEPSSFWLLLTALGCCLAWGVRLRAA